MNLVVVDVELWLGIEHHITFDATDAPKILTFEIGSIGKAVDLHRQFVFTRTHQTGYVKLGIGLGILSEAYELPIHPYVIGRLHRTEVDVDATVFPFRRD